MAHLLGYARVSTSEQNPDLQLDALKGAGCFRVFVDRANGALDERPELSKALDQLRPGDTLVVWKLDRLGRSLRHLIRSWRSTWGWPSTSGPGRSRSRPRSGHRRAAPSRGCRPGQ